MTKAKKKYYALDDLHFIGDSKMTKKQREDLNKKTKDFFDRRRKGSVTKVKSEKV